MRSKIIRQKVKHKIDSGLYAIKEVTLHSTQQAQINRATREVEVATQFNHQNIVRYHTSWQSFDVKGRVFVSILDFVSTGFSSKWVIIYTNNL